MGAVRSARHSLPMRIRKQVLVVLTAGSFLFVGISGATAAGLNGAEAGLLGAVNQTRAAHGLRPVRLDPTLERAARAHSADMVRNSYFAHGPVIQRLHAFGVRSSLLG